MKKSPPKKLVLKREAVRHLDRLELGRVGGGGADTGDATCPWTHVGLPVNGGGAGG